MATKKAPPRRQDAEMQFLDPGILSGKKNHVKLNLLKQGYQLLVRSCHFFRDISNSGKTDDGKTQEIGFGTRKPYKCENALCYANFLPWEAWSGFDQDEI